MKKVKTKKKKVTTLKPKQKTVIVKSSKKQPLVASAKSTTSKEFVLVSYTRPDFLEDFEGIITSFVVLEKKDWEEYLDMIELFFHNHKGKLYTKNKEVKFTDFTDFKSMFKVSIISESEKRFLINKFEVSAKFEKEGIVSSVGKFPWFTEEVLESQNEFDVKESFADLEENDEDELDNPVCTDCNGLGCPECENEFWDNDDYNDDDDDND